MSPAVDIQGRRGRNSRGWKTTQQRSRTWLRGRAGWELIASLNEPCQYCSQPLTAYPLILSDDAEQTVYHAACALQVATEILVDLYTFFSPPAPY